MESLGSRHRDVVDFLLAAGWGFATLIAAGTYLVAGFYGWLAIFAWSLAAGPLFVLTARRLTVQRRPLDARCRVLAIRWWSILTLATLTTGLSPALLALRHLPLVAGLTAIGMWFVFVGQLVYVFSATRWIVGQILALGQARVE